MNDYNSSYSVILPKYDQENLILLQPDNKTVKSGKGYSIITSGRPLFFINAYAERFGPGKLEEKVTDFMFDTPYPVVSKKVKDFLSDFEINGLQIYPAVFIGLDNKYYEDLWFLNFHTELDCWDRKNSKVDTDGIIEGGDPNIEKFVLDETILNEIDEENRLMFKMGGLSEYYIFVHKKISDFFASENISGVQVIPVNSYEDGSAKMNVSLRVCKGNGIK